MSDDRKRVSIESLLKAQALINKKLQQAVGIHGPGVYVNYHECLGIITEEYQELVMAVRRNRSEDIVNELADVAISAIWGIASREEERRDDLSSL